MDQIDKIKALQSKVGINADGIVSSKTWLNIHYLLFGSVPYDINISSIIKSIQKKIEVRADGYPWDKTWDALYDLLIVDEKEVLVDAHNEEILEQMTKEVIPFAKELINLAADEGINIRIAKDPKQTVKDKSDSIFTDISTIHSIYNFGLAFDVKILATAINDEAEEPTAKLPLYDKIAKLGESIGLTWTGNLKTVEEATKFILRPAWAVRMKEVDMMKELYRRKKENINLLAIL
ncbi:MAG: M15 family peptidase [Pedobacter sp.]|nr:MAG: M15 family peptidase [Pedobacter sp.]